MTMPDKIWAWLFMPEKRDDVIKGGWNDERDRNDVEYISRTAVDAMIAEAVAKEREACAAVADRITECCQSCAWSGNAIRARGQET